MLLATHVLRHTGDNVLNPPQRLSDIFRGIVDANGQIPRIAQYMPQHTNAAGEEITPRLVIDAQHSRTHAASVHELDYNNHGDQATWRENFQNFWNNLSRRARTIAWRNYWRVAFHANVAAAQIWREIRRPPGSAICDCRSCESRRTHFLRGAQDPDGEAQ